MPLDRDVLLRFRSGEATAFAQVVREFDTLVRAVVGRHFRSGFEREEAMQEVWTHAYRQRGSLDVNRLGAFPGWLAILAKRRCLDLLRKPASTAAATEEEATALLAELEADANPAADAESAELDAAATAFRETLATGWREFFDLHFVQGLEYEAVAEQLSINKLRCKYMKKVLALKARRDPRLRAALGRSGGRR